MRKLLGCALVGGLVLASAFIPSATSSPLPGSPRCKIFPKSNPWNQRVDDLPVHRRSRAIINSIGRNTGLHPDFGSGQWDGGPIGIPYVTVPRDQKRVPVRFRYKSESDPGPYPIPKNAPIEGGRQSDGDRHVIVVDRGRCKLFELFAAYPRDNGERWRAGSGAIWDLDSNRLRPKGHTSADAAGLPILPGLVRPDEVKKGKIDHALRFTVEQTRRKFIYPARHFASELTASRFPAMGQRVRLKKSFDISGFSRQPRIILKALKRYGMMVADNGSDWYITGTPSPKWNNGALHELDRVKGRHFQVVDTSSLRP